MNITLIRSAMLLIVLLLCATLSPCASTPFADTFQWPFDLEEDWNADKCEGVGYIFPPSDGGHTYHLKWSNFFGGVHAGNDWNGVCGSDTDLGGKILSMANGTVIEVKRDALPIDTFGNFVMVEHVLGNLKRVHSLYAHLDTVEEHIEVGYEVSIGEQIGTLGSTGVVTNPHLHWELRVGPGLGLEPEANPYYGGNRSDGTPRLPAIPGFLAMYTSPSLFIDDHLHIEQVALEKDEWVEFTVPEHAPGNSAFISRGPYRGSLVAAEQQGVIDSDIFVFHEGQWKKFNGPGLVFFFKDMRYAVRARMKDVVLNYYITGDNFRDDRAREDIARLFEGNGNIQHVHTEEEGDYGFTVDLDGHLAYETRTMVLETDLFTVPYIAVDHITFKDNPWLIMMRWNDIVTGRETYWYPPIWESMQVTSGTGYDELPMDEEPGNDSPIFAPGPISLDHVATHCVNGEPVVVLNWNKSKRTWWYTLYRDGERMARMRSRTKYADKEVQAGHSYKYRIVANNLIGRRGSNIVHVTIPYDKCKPTE